ncbi:MAG: acyl-CoA synthetase [Candidatus Tectimicrobiota bacterium]
MGETLLPHGTSYNDVYARFRWQLPRRFNIALATCDRHAADAQRVAMLFENDSGQVSSHTFAEFRARSNQLAQALRDLGVVPGERLAIILSQRPETAVAHLAAYKLGAIALPLSTLFGPEALEYRLHDAGAAVVITDTESLERLLGVRANLPALRHIICVDRAEASGVLDYQRLLRRASTTFTPVVTALDDPALLIYTSGTTGPPKGALHAQRVLLGHLPAIEFYHEYCPQPGDRFWTPADWAWIGGLYDILFPSWYYGITVVAHRMRRFDAAQAFDVMARHQVRNTFLVPTALKMMRQIAQPLQRYPVRLRSMFTGGEAVGEEVIRWARETLGVTPHEGYGQTEVNLVLGNCSALMPVKAGSMGRPIPGHRVEVVDASGQPLPAGELGEVAIQRPDPVMFLGYWNNPQATADKFLGDWALTGDLARKDEEGYFWFVGRKDDVISSGGYRIGPGEIEDCLAGHAAVAVAAVVGSPHPVRGEVVKAFVQLRAGVTPSPALARELAEYVRTRLSAHEYPREIEFMAELPTTTTGKVIRRALREREQQRPPGGAL